LYTKNTPDPDLIVRTGGEMRLSNFLLLQAAYSELHFSDTLWPDFAPKELDQIIEQYNTRKRKFGAVK
jgi:undecaprenyl diphosphate synthase